MLIPNSPEEISHEQVVRFLQKTTEALEAIRLLLDNIADLEDNWFLQETFGTLRGAVGDLEDGLFKLGRRR